MQVIAESLSEEEIKGLKSMFANMDTDKSGTITYEELKSGLARLGSKLSEVEVQQLMDAVSSVHFFSNKTRALDVFSCAVLDVIITILLLILYMYFIFYYISG